MAAPLTKSILSIIEVIKDIHIMEEQGGIIVIKHTMGHLLITREEVGEWEDLHLNQSSPNILPHQSITVIKYL